MMAGIAPHASRMRNPTLASANGMVAASVSPTIAKNLHYSDTQTHTPEEQEECGEFFGEIFGEKCHVMRTDIIPIKAQKQRRKDQTERNTTRNTIIMQKAKCKIVYCTMHNNAARPSQKRDTKTPQKTTNAEQMQNKCTTNAQQTHNNCTANAEQMQNNKCTTTNAAPQQMQNH